MSFLQSWSADASRSSYKDDRPHASIAASQLRPQRSSSYIDGLTRNVHLHLHAEKLRQELQHSLDAQAAALAAQVSGKDQAASIASSPSRSSTSSGVVPVRQPVSKPVSLADSRRNIATIMHDLLRVEQEEFRLAGAALQRERAQLQRFSSWISQREELRAAIGKIRQDKQQGGRIVELQSEAAAVAEQIDNLEAQLTELKSRQRAVKLELASLENSVESELSSYTASLALLDREVDQHVKASIGLTSRPSHSQTATLPKSVSGGHALEALRDCALQDEEKTLADRDRHELETQALEQGIPVWNKVVGLVTSFERLLQREIGCVNSEDASSRLQSLLVKLDSTIAVIESELDMAEVKDWKLLMCAIGAELDALSQGREVLAEFALATTTQDASTKVPSVGGATPVETSTILHTDDEPGPDLFVSQVDTDTE